SRYRLLRNLAASFDGANWKYNTLTGACSALGHFLLSNCRLDVDQIRIPIRTGTCRDLCTLHLFTERTSAGLPVHKGDEPNTSSRAGSVRGNRLLPFGLAWCCRCHRCNTLARTHAFGASCLSWSSGHAHLLVVE